MKLACAGLLATLLVFLGLMWWIDNHLSPWMLTLTTGWAFVTGMLFMLTLIDVED